LEAVDNVIVTGAPLTAGNYWLRGNEGDLIGYSANLSPQDTFLTRIESQQLDLLFGDKQYALVRDREEINLAEGKASDARSLYAWVMIIVALLFALEQLLSNYFYASNHRTDSAAGRRKLQDAAVSA
jgi:hypothetical protein